MTATNLAQVLDFPFSVISLPPQPNPDKRPPSKRIYVCSPYRGNTAKNVARAQVYCRFIYDKGFIPVAPHLYYPQFLDDKDPDERVAGMKYARGEINRCKELWVFGLNISDGMLEEIEYAEKRKIHVRWYNDNLEEI